MLSRLVQCSVHMCVGRVIGEAILMSRGNVSHVLLKAAKLCSNYIKYLSLALIAVYIS